MPLARKQSGAVYLQIPRNPFVKYNLRLNVIPASAQLVKLYPNCGVIPNMVA